MGKMLLGLAAAMAAIAITAPATAGTPEDAFEGIPNAKGSLGTFGGSGGFGVGGGFHVGFGNDGFGDHRSNRRRSGSSDGGGVWVNGGEWAHYNNRSFAADSYNDWWHDNPNHSQPAWVRNNQGCERQWFAGDVLRC